jgi:hypothetical protein
MIFVKNIPQDDDTLMADLGTSHLLIFDDKMRGNANDLIVDCLMHIVHHGNTSLILIMQNLFNRGAQHRTISLNAHYLVFFLKNPNDKWC